MEETCLAGMSLDDYFYTLRHINGFCAEYGAPWSLWRPQPGLRVRHIRPDTSMRGWKSAPVCPGYTREDEKVSESQYLKAAQ